MQNQIHLKFEGKNAKLRLCSPRKHAAKPQKTNSQGEHIQSLAIVQPPLQDVNAEEILTSDAELNLLQSGQILEETTRAYLNSQGQVVGDFQKIAIQLDPKGNEVSRKPKVSRLANINDLNPVEVIQTVPVQALLKKYAIKRIYQLAHTDGVQFDFLYQLAKHLSESKKAGLLAVGQKKLPLIFKNEGVPYRCALYGQTQNNTYKLLLLILGQELKLPNPDA